MPRPKRITPDMVIETAIALANTHGFAAVTLASVAAQLEIRVPSLYNHVEGLAGLRREMTVWGMRLLAEQLRDAAIGKAGDDAIRSMAHAYRAFAHQNPGIYAVTLRATDADHPAIASASAAILGVVTAVLAVYHLDDTDALHTVRALRSFLHGFVDLEVLGGFDMPLERDESFDHMIALFLSGLHNRPN